MSRFDVVVFGATGYTGKFVVRELAQMVKQQVKLTWAVAGRSKEKLGQVLSAIAKDTGVDGIYETPVNSH